MIKSTIKSLSPQHIKSTVIGNTNVMVSSTVKEGGDVEIDPVFRNSVAYNITQQDVDYWNAGAGVDLSSYVTYDFLSSQAYVTASDLSQQSYVTTADLSQQSYVTTADLSQQSYVTASDLSQQSYLTAETDPVFSASVAANITQQDVDNWNAATGGVDLSAYVTKEQLVNQSYLQTEIDPVFTSSVAAGITQQDIENWNRGGSVDLSSYVTYDYLSAQSYLQTETEPAFNASPAATITTEDIQKWDTGSGIDLSSYVTKSELSAQSYLTTENDPVFSASPAASITDTDIANWNAAAGTIDMSAYVTKLQLTEMSYVTKNELASQSYIQNESDPIFSASPAATITTEDIQNWNAGGSVDLSSYVTKQELSAQAYLTSVTFPDYSNTYQSKGNYLTSETDPVFSASVAANITQQDVDNWNAATGGVDLSAYVTKEQLVNQSYITINDVTYPDYSNTYQAKGEYITPAQLSAQSYIKITDVVFPDYSNTYQAKGNYLTSETDPVFTASPAATITAQDITNWNAGAGIDLSSYVTKTELSNQSYIKITDVVFPDYSNTYQAIGEYITPTQLSAQSYVTASDLSQQSYLTSETDPVFSASPAAGITSQDIENWNTGAAIDLTDYLKWRRYNSSSYVFGGINVTYTFENEIYDIDPSPEVAYLFDIKTTYYTGLNWSYIATLTSGVTKNSAMASLNANHENDVQADLKVRVDSDKSFIQGQADYIQFSADEIKLFGNPKVEYNNLLYPIASYQYVADTLVAQSYITTSDLSAQSYLTSETDPVFSASPAAGITSQDIENWNNGSGIDLSSYVTKTDLVNQSYIKITDVVFPDYSNTYQAKGEYITPTQLVNQSYITINDVVFPDYSNTYQAKGDYVTKTEMSAQSYITPATLSAQAYLTSVTFPDYSSTYQAVGDYVTKSQLSSQSYINANYITTNRYLMSSYPFTGATKLYTEGMDIYNGSVFPKRMTYTEVNNSTYYDSFISNQTVKNYVSGFLQNVLPNYVSETELVSQSYVTKSQLSAQSYITPATLIAQSYVTQAGIGQLGYTSVQIVTQAEYEDRQDDILYIISDAPVTDLSSYATIAYVTNNFATIAYVTNQIGNIETLLSQI